MAKFSEVAKETADNLERAANAMDSLQQGNSASGGAVGGSGGGGGAPTLDLTSVVVVPMNPGIGPRSPAGREFMQLESRLLRALKGDPMGIRTGSIG